MRNVARLIGLRLHHSTVTSSVRTDCGKGRILSLVLLSPLMKSLALVFYVVWARPSTYPRCLNSLSSRSWLKRGVQGPTALPSCLHAFSLSQHLF